MIARVLQRVVPLVVLLALGGGCAPATPTAVAPTSAPPTAVAAKPTAVAPAPTTAPTTAPTAAIAPAKPTLVPTSAANTKLTVSLVPPQVEGNEIRMLNEVDLPQLRPMYEYLIGLDAQSGKLVPQLATGWQVEDGGLTVRFALRPNIPFHAGKGTFSSKDVVRVWKEMTRDDSKFAQADYWRKTVKEIQTPASTEVVFKLNQPDANFLNAISERQGGMEMYSADNLDAMGGTPTLESGPPVGTGPYQYKERVQGSYIRFERVPFQHWRIQPDFQTLEIRFQKEPGARLASLKSGEVQITTLPQDLLQQAQQAGFKTARGLVPGQRVFLSIFCCWAVDRSDPSKGVRYPDSPLTDVRVRKALSKAINRDELNKAFFGGKADVMYLSHFDKTRLGWNPDWQTRFSEEYGYDPVAAKALLADAGYSGDKKLQTTAMLLNLFSGADDIMEAIGGYWRDIGVDAQLQRMDAGQFRTDASAYKFSNAFRIYSSGSNQLLAMGFNSYIGWEGVQYPDTDALVEQIYHTVDEQQQDKLWRQLGDLMYDRHMGVPLFWTPVEAVYDPKVVSSYPFPGIVPGIFNDFEQVKAAH